MQERVAGPDFLIIGAPRCGTSSLYEMLSQHPDIYMSPVKEPHYYASIDFPFPENEILHVTKDEAAYEKLFSKAGNRLRGEASSYYLADPKAARNIKQANPNIKLVALLRDPIDRAYSHYLLYQRRGQQKTGFYEQVRQLTALGGPLVYNIVELGKYGGQLERYYKEFSSKQLLVVMFDDLINKPVETLRVILRHLGVDESQAEKLQLQKGHNQYQVPRSHLAAKLTHHRILMSLSLKLLPRPLLRQIRNRLVLKKGSSDDKKPLEPGAIKALSTIYQPELKRVAELLGHDVPKLYKTTLR